jgi:hypothetical protein
MHLRGALEAEEAVVDLDQAVDQEAVRARVQAVAVLEAAVLRELEVELELARQVLAALQAQVQGVAQA